MALIIRRSLRILLLWFCVAAISILVSNKKVVFQMLAQPLANLQKIMPQAFQELCGKMAALW
jgi:hypothetical protein